MYLSILFPLSYIYIFLLLVFPFCDHNYLICATIPNKSWYKCQHILLCILPLELYYMPYHILAVSNSRCRNASTLVLNQVLHRMIDLLFKLSIANCEIYWKSMLCYSPLLRIVVVVHDGKELSQWVWMAVKRVLSYLKGTTEHGLLLQKSSSLDLVAYLDVH